MSSLFLCFTIFLIGGFFNLIFFRQVKLMKTLAAIFMTVGCSTGLYAVASLSASTDIPTISFEWLRFLHLSFSLDTFSAYFLVPIFLICPCVSIYACQYLDHDEHGARIALSNFFFALFVLAMCLVVCANDFLTLAMAWEVMSIFSYFLVLYEFQRKQTRQAGYLYILFAQAGAMCIFASIGLIYSYTGDFSFSSMQNLPEHAKLPIFLLALLGFGSKAGIFPVHIWLPHAHPAAPSHISATMSGVMIKIGIYGILRMYFLLNSSSPVYGQLIVILGCISGVLGVVYALGKHDIKRLLAYHSVENIGIILIGAGLGMMGIASGQPYMALLGFSGSLLHVLNHSIFKSLLFLGAGALGQMTKTRKIDEMGGVLRLMPLTGASFLTGSISISGLPPFNGFISEFLIYCAAFCGLKLSTPVFLSAGLAIIALSVIGGLALACFAKVYGIVFLGDPRTNKYTATGREARISMTAPQIFLALICLVIGIFPKPFVQLANYGVMSLLHTNPLLQHDLLELTKRLSIATLGFLSVLGGIFLLRAILDRKKPITVSSTWGCGYTQPNSRIQYTGTSFARSIIEFFEPFVHIRTQYHALAANFPKTASYDTKVHDIAELALHYSVVRPLLKLLDLLRWIQQGRIQAYIGYIVAAIILLLMFL